jgi:UDP-3-O-[3-hydroxymyristoyl] glucosamine N-acyltransferase
MKSKGLQDIKKIIDPLEIVGDKNAKFNNAKPIDEADKNSIIWIKSDKTNKEEIINSTRASFIITDSSFNRQNISLKEKCIIVTDNPKLTFLRIVQAFFTEKINFGIHPSAIIHQDAKIHKETYIGPHTYIGKCTIGKGTIIYGNCFLYDKVIVGKNVKIHAGTVIGSEGYGYSRNSQGEFEVFPHIGGVIIEDNVDIGANTCIDRGALGNTIIKLGAKIDNLVHIAHNVIVGKHAAVIANAMIGGSVIIDDYAWVAPSASIMNQIHIGEKSTVGLGAVVTKNIPENEVWAGSPAMPIKQLIDIQKKIKSL